MTPLDLPVVLPVVQQHAEEVAMLKRVRSVLLRSPHVQLHRLRRLDDRMAAHLDGVLQAGEVGLSALLAALEAPTPGAVFALAVAALQTRNASQLTRLVAVAEALPEVEAGLLSALGWVSSEDLQGTVRALLGSKVGRHRAWALAACAMHHVDPGAVLTQAVQDLDARVRARAWRVAAQLGRRDLADAARAALLPGGALAADEHATVLVSPHLKPGEYGDDRCAAAWALTLWGMGANELVRQALMSAPPGKGALPPQDAHRLAVLASDVAWGRDQVRALAPLAESSPVIKRRMMRLVAWVGDVQAVPWLIQHMGDDKWSRLAGECLTLITGVDLVAEGLERTAADPGPQGGPTDDPDDVDVSMDQDDGLPWPDPARVQAWWRARAQGHVQGQRYFMGEAPGVSHLKAVLRQGAQRQRIMAAEHLGLLLPEGGLFQVAAPAWRQSRWLTEGETLSGGK